MSFFVFTSRASTEAAVLSLFSVVKKTFCASPFFHWLSNCCYVSFPIHYSRITAFLFTWCEGVKQMQISEQPEAPARLNLSPSSCQSQIIASTTKRQGQFRNRFREIGESSGRWHVHFCAVTSVHEHNTYSIKERLKNRALHVHVKDWIFADEQPVEPGNLKTAGTSGDGRNGFLRLPVVFPSLCCKAPLVWWIRPKWQRSNTPVVCKTLSQSLFG